MSPRYADLAAAAVRPRCGDGHTTLTWASARECHPSGVGSRRVSHFATVALTTATALAVSMALAGCGLHRVPDSSFLDLHVRNNTRPTVTLVIPGIPGNDRLYNEEGIYESAWRNNQPGIALVRIVSGRKTLGCLKVHYRKGQEHATALVSAATPCSS